MKVLIEIDERFYQWVKMCGIMPFITAGKVIPDNATNGDMIQALFPNASVYEHGSTYSINNEYNFNSTWWNAPYKGVE